MMKGYRTLIFSALMTAIGMLGFKVSPATALHWGDMYVAAWGIGAILLRQLTSTPVGTAATQAVLDAASSNDLAELRSGLASLLEHAKLAALNPQPLTAMAQKIDALLATLTPASSSGVAAGAGTTTAKPAPAPAPIPAPPTASAPAIVPTVAGAQAAPAVVHVA
jgi:hypothetical protein